MPAPRKPTVSPEIRFLRTKKQISETFEVMRQLRPKLSRTEYLRLVGELGRKFGYRLMSLKVDKEVKCVAGFRICHSLGWGKYLYVDELVTDSRSRSHGLGSKALKALVEYAKKAGCGQLRLDSKLNRHRAHRFYLRERMDIECFHFLARLR